MDGCDEEGRQIRHAPQVVIVQKESASIALYLSDLHSN